MGSPARQDCAKFILRVHADQKRALDVLADERDVAVASLIREAIGAITGVRDPLFRQRRPRRPAEAEESEIATVVSNRLDLPETPGAGASAPAPSPSSGTRDTGNNHEDWEVRDEQHST